jgi:branched-chain amino acid transport system substrate-binding protein
VLRLALGKLGKPPGLAQEDRVKLNELVADTNIKTFYGPIRFESGGDHFHDNTEPPPILIQIKRGKIVAVAPENVQEGELEYPIAQFGGR